jgi:hypothetical protein
MKKWTKKSHSSTLELLPEKKDRFGRLRDPLQKPILEVYMEDY